jgi:glycerophosphoryl diester phosphodiesterase
MLRIGHRGAAGYEPENTLRSIERAISLSVDFVEFDVQRTRDGYLVLLHDKRVDRTTNGSGYLTDLSLAEVGKLDAGKGERIPTFQEVLRLTSGRVGLMLEIITPGIAGQVCRVVHEEYEGTVIYASFLHAEVLQLRRLLPDARTLALFEGIPVDPIGFAEDAGVTHVGLAIDSLTDDFVGALQKGGYEVFGYTANDPRDIRWLRQLQINGIISDYPDRV